MTEFGLFLDSMPHETFLLCVTALAFLVYSLREQ